MTETIETIVAWHKATFPDITVEEQKEKFNSELREYRLADSERQTKSIGNIANKFLSNFAEGV